MKKIILITAFLLGTSYGFSASTHVSNAKKDGECRVIGTMVCCLIHGHWQCGH